MVSLLENILVTPQGSSQLRVSLGISHHRSTAKGLGNTKRDLIFHKVDFTGEFCTNACSDTIINNTNTRESMPHKLAGWN
jgi:hypothetical protein